ncbi:DUF2927 domain-containing protein [Pseudorhodoplanes sp.]|uniref:DUF2927 domain-containing protein n=1 Tax=Pseudorhodoplanes sp. TaxID=1934341 RepID=UPI003918F077
MVTTRIWLSASGLPVFSRMARRAIAMLSALAIAAMLWPAAAAAEHPEVTKRRAEERKAFTDAEIIDGFFRIVFGAEFHVSGRVDRIRKYEGPVRVYVESRAKPDRRKQVERVVADIRSKIPNLDIAMAESRDDANVTVTLVRDRDLKKTIREFYGREQAARIVKSLEPQCLSGFRKDDLFRIQHSDVIVVVDAGEFIFLDCMYEELLQALGPINDDDDLPWTMFNDEVQMAFFGIYDQYLLNILYDPRIRAGMTKEQVKALLPQVLPDVRALVARLNGLQD